jgi:hypothetical protein
MSNPTHKETGWPAVCNVVSSTAGNGTLIGGIAGKRAVLVGISVKGNDADWSLEDEVTLREGDQAGTILCHLNQYTLGVFPGRIPVTEGQPVFLDGEVACTIWYYYENL